MGEDDVEGRQTDEDVDQAFEPSYGSEDEVNHVPVAAAEPFAETDESPVETANDEKYEGGYMCCFHVY